MIDFNKEELNVMFYAISHLMDSTDTELGNISPDDDQKENFEKQLGLCRRVIDKLRGKTDIG